MGSSFENVSALWLESNKLFWKESTYTKYLFISKNADKIICDCSLEEINSKIVQQTVNQILICKPLHSNAMSKDEEKRFFIDNLRGVWYSVSKRKQKRKGRQVYEQIRKSGTDQHVHDL